MTALAGWFRDQWTRLMAGLALAVVAVVTGVISYTHIYGLTLALHQPVLVARLYAFGVDGLIVVGSVVLLQAGASQPWLGWLGVVPGVATSVFANVESGIRYGMLAAIWAGVPAASFALATFLLERWLKAQAGQDGKPGQANTGTEDDPDHDNDSDLCTHVIGSTAEIAAVQAFLHARDCLSKPLSQRQLSAAFGLTRPKVAELVGPLNGHAPADPDLN
jgi:hypothetical protein